MSRFDDAAALIIPRIIYIYSYIHPEPQLIKDKWTYNIILEILTFSQILYKTRVTLNLKWVGILPGVHIGITRTELNAHPCQIFLCNMSVKRVLYCLITKLVRFFDFINRTEIFKTSLNVTKLKVWLKNILAKNLLLKSYTHYFNFKKIYLRFSLNNTIIQY